MRRPYRVIDHAQDPLQGAILSALLRGPKSISQIRGDLLEVVTKSGATRLRVEFVWSMILDHESLEKMASLCDHCLRRLCTYPALSKRLRALKDSGWILYDRRRNAGPGRGIWRLNPNLDQLDHSGEGIHDRRTARNLRRKKSKMNLRAFDTWINPPLARYAYYAEPTGNIENQHDA